MSVARSARSRWQISTISGRFLSSGRTATLYGARSGWRAEDDPRLAADLLLAVGVDQERERRPVGAGRGLDDPRDEVLVGGLVEVLEVLAGRLRVATEVEVAPVVDALELLPAEREAVLDVDRLLRVVGELVGRVLAEAQPGGRHAVALVPGAGASAAIPRTPPSRLAGPDEVLHLHLLELAHPEDEVARADLVPERLPDLGDPERDLLARALLDVLEVDVRALGGLGPEVDDRGVVLDRAHVRLEHQVEPARRRQRAAVVRAVRPRRWTTVGSQQVGRRQVLGAGQLVEAVAAVAGRALDERVAERPDVARRDPDLGVHQDPGIEPDDVVALLDHRPPPGPLDVVLQLDPERPVVPDGVDAAVDLGATGRRSRAASRARRSSRGWRRRARRRLGSVDGGGVGHGGLLGAGPGMAGRERG